MDNYETLSEALDGLKKHGFTTDFNLAFNQLKCSASGQCFSPSEFEIVAHYRFEGNTDPADEAVLYAISAKNGSVKGSLVNAYGAYGETISDEMIMKLSINE